MPTFKEQLKTIESRRQALAHAEAQYYSAKLRLQRQTGATAPTDKTPRDLLPTEVKKVAEARIGLVNAIKTLHDEPGGLTALTANLDDNLPVLLLPVRIETVFEGAASNNPELWVRIFPDDIHQNGHETLLSDAEVQEGKIYWNVLFTADRQPDPYGESPENLKKKAWKNLVDLFGHPRSLWIARQTAPINRYDTAAATPTFPKIAETKPYPWTLPPTSRALPDRFVLLIYKNNQVVDEIPGNLIPDTLSLGPDPFLGQDAFRKTADEVVFDPEFDWMVNFNRAVELGMGFRVKLQAKHFDTPMHIQRIAVLGVMHSADAVASQSILENLLEAHHFAPKGLAIVPQGTPTNHTAQEDAGFDPNDIFLRLGYFDLPVPGSTSLFKTLSDCDGARLSQALGIRPESLEEVSAAETEDGAEARLMNQLLFPATFGFFLDTLLDPVVPQKYAAIARQFFTSHVSGRGPLPTLRVGEQPYGVLPVSLFSKWTVAPAALANTDEAAFLKMLHGLLDYFRSEAWLPAAAELRNARNSGDDPEVLLEQLARQPGSVRFNARPGFQQDLMLAVGMFQKIGFKTASETRSRLFRKVLEPRNNNAPSQTLLEQIVWSPGEHVTQFTEKNLVDKLPSSESRLIQPLSLDEDKSFLHWLATVNQVEDIERQQVPGSGAPNTLLYLLLRHALLLELMEAIRSRLDPADQQFLRSALRKSFVHFEKNNNDFTDWALLYATMGQLKLLNPNDPSANMKAGDYFLSTFGEDKRIAQFRAGVAQIAKLPTARLERCLTEHLDILSYRLDAWITALFSHRLTQLRQPSGAASRQGIYLGAYGWIEDLSPKGSTPVAEVRTPLAPEGQKRVSLSAENVGIVQAPTVNHATMAALIMAGYRQRADKNNPNLFAVNLQSARVRRALRLIDGIRTGLTVEAVLGQQFERALHDNKMDYLILDFRKNYSIPTQRLPPENGSTDPTESLPLRDVADGLQISRLLKTTDFKAGIVFKANAHKTEVLKIAISLAEVFDAAGDLLTAETVFQITQNRIDQGGDILRSLRDADTLPPNLEVAQQPRSNRLSLTNRIGICLPEVPGDFWDNTRPAAQKTSREKLSWKKSIPHSPRSMAEPALNAWLARLFGKPEDTCCAISSHDADGNESATLIISLDELNLQAIDFLYLASLPADNDGMLELEKRLVRAYRLHPNVPQGGSTRIDYHPSGATARPLARLLPLARAIGRMLEKLRPLNALDCQPPTVNSSTAGANKQQWLVPEFEHRIRFAADSLRTALIDFEKIELSSSQPDGSSSLLGGVLASWQEAHEDNQLLEKWEFKNAQHGMRNTFLEKISAFGIPGALSLPEHSAPPDEDRNTTITPAVRAARATLAECGRFWQEARRRLTGADADLAAAGSAPDADARIKQLVAAGKSLFGSSFVLLPRFSLDNAEDLSRSNADSAQLLQFFALKYNLPPTVVAEEWIQSVAAVRPHVAAWEQVRSFAEALNRKEASERAMVEGMLVLAPAQLPYREKDTWLALEFPAVDASTGKPWTVNRPTLSLVLSGDIAWKSEQPECSGLLVDSWTEAIPTSEETTGVAFHFNQPNSAPPQAMLLALSPSLSGKWSWENLKSILGDTYELMKLRLVEPKKIYENTKAETFLPMLVSRFDTEQTNISLDFATASDSFIKNNDIQSLKLYRAFKKA